MSPLNVLRNPSPLERVRCGKGWSAARVGGGGGNRIHQLIAERALSVMAAPPTTTNTLRRHKFVYARYPPPSHSTPQPSLLVQWEGLRLDNLLKNSQLLHLRSSCESLLIKLKGWWACYLQHVFLSSTCEVVLGEIIFCKNISDMNLSST